MTKQIVILGSTGSVGTHTLDVIRHLGPSYQVAALAAKSQIDLLEKQIAEFRPSLVAVYDEKKALELQRRVPHVPVLAGLKGLMEAAVYAQAGIVISAMVGTLGLAPTLAAVNAGKTLGLANKEALVTGGALLMESAKKNNARILPIDSEHSAIFQCLSGEDIKNVRRLILTASGGPFRSYTAAQLENATIDQALQHPTWKMGPKITIDCSTLMNKGLELIEAYWLFGVPLQQIEVVIHPQSLIHSMVEYEDFSTIAQLSEPSMVLPIQYALTYPSRCTGLGKPFDFTKMRTLEFSPPDMQKFRCLALAREAIKSGKSMPPYMNAANEVLVERFINRQLSWVDIGAKLDHLMQKHHLVSVKSYEEIAFIDDLARREAAIV